MSKITENSVLLKNSNITNIIVGLGNPDEKYKNTRHNVGFIVLDFLSEKYGIKFKYGKFDSQYDIFSFCGKKVLFLKPMTYMNLSGKSVIAAMNFYKVSSENVLVVFDDINLAVGRMRIRKDGSHGGHNGMKNILSLCGNFGFPRIKIGVGINPENFPLDKWVVSNFDRSERILISEICPHVEEAIKLILEGNIAKAMNFFNGLDLSKS